MRVTSILLFAIAFSSILLASAKADSANSKTPPFAENLSSEICASDKSNLKEDLTDIFKKTKNLSLTIRKQEIVLVLRKYIPPDASFDVAECQLKKGGFIIDTDPFNWPKRKDKRYDQTVATLKGIGKPWHSISPTNLIVRLIPKEKDNFDLVGEIQIQFDSVMP